MPMELEGNCGVDFSGGSFVERAVRFLTVRSSIGSRAVHSDRSEPQAAAYVDEADVTLLTFNVAHHRYSLRVDAPHPGQSGE